jgi:uncharacterized protein (TIGR00369 family)
MAETGLSRAELEHLKREFERVPFAHLVGLQLGDLARGSATLHLQLREELMRNGGLLHGGATASLIDTAAAFAVLTVLAPGQVATTVDLAIQYLRPVTTGRIEARARLLRDGKRIAVVSVDVLGESQQLMATATTTYLKRP